MWVFSLNANDSGKDRKGEALAKNLLTAGKDRPRNREKQVLNLPLLNKSYVGFVLRIISVLRRSLNTERCMVSFHISLEGCKGRRMAWDSARFCHTRREGVRIAGREYGRSLEQVLRVKLPFL